MKICTATRQWHPDPSSSYAHIGAFWLAEWSANRRWKSMAIPSIVVTTLILALYLITEFKSEWIASEWAPPLVFGVGILLAFFYIPLLLTTVWMSRKKILARLFVPEFWIAVFIGSSLATKWPWTFENLLPLVAVAVFFLILRIVEALVWRSHLDQISFKEETYWVGRLSEWEYRRSIVFGAVGLAIVMTAAAFNSWTLLAMIPFCLPLGPWMITRLAERSENEGWLVQDFSFFRNLRNKSLAIFHSTGVLTTGNLKVTASWLDSESEWSADDVRDIVLQLTTGRMHPMATALEDHFEKPKRFLFELEDIELLPHLGLEASFQDPRRSRIKVIFGTISWHRTLQSEMADEGRKQIKNWVESGSHVSLLAINQTIVAAFCFSDRWRENGSDCFQALHKEGISATAMSSSCMPIPDSLGCDESKWDLFPIERKLQLKIWTEKKAKAFEVKSFWDGSAAIQMPVVCMRPLEYRPLDDEALTLLSDKLSSLPAVVRASKSFHRSLWFISALTFLSALICLGIPNVYLALSTSLLLYIGSLFWISKFALK